MNMTKNIMYVAEKVSWTKNTLVFKDLGLVIFFIKMFMKKVYYAQQECDQRYSNNIHFISIFFKM